MNIKAREIEKQLILLKNNTEAMNITKNYLKNLQNGVSTISDVLLKIKEDIEYSLRSLDIILDGYMAVYDDVEKIIKA